MAAAALEQSPAPPRTTDGTRPRRTASRSPRAPTGPALRSPPSGPCPRVSAAPTPCPCGRGVAAESRPRFPGAGAWAARLRVCAACELVFLDAPDAPGGGGYSFRGGLDMLSGWLRHRRAAWVARRLAPGAAVLDVGAGPGQFLAELHRRGFRVRGVELDAERARAAPPGVRVDAGTLAERRAELLAAAPFDAVVFWHALEHHAAPVADLRRAAELLAPGGLLFVAVPNAGSVQARLAGPRWLHLDLPNHRFHFTPATLAAAARDGGFAPQSLKTGQWEMDVVGFADALATRAGLPPRFCFDALARGTGYGLAKRAAAVVLLALLTPIAVVLSFVCRLAGRAGTLILVARRGAPLEPAA